ncbi:RAD55 family ATPase [Halosimplex halophilum]|uniref:RAD55 family ATPase n=1 Tax=Halosimplex halophilum TaxID=2559572 RepID=UPI00107F64BA|nr:hypothetical protein [Halosimplex halophilum]
MGDTDRVLSGDSLASLDPGTNVLIRGPSMVGKREATLGLLATGLDTGDGLVYAATDESADSVVAYLSRDRPSSHLDRVGIIDCSGRGRSRVSDRVAVESVSAPSDLTGISIGTAKLVARLSNGGVPSIRYGVHSVSTLLHYLDTPTVFKFLHIYTARIRKTDGIGVFTLESSAHDSKTVHTIASEFDGVIELREGDDGRERRVSGLAGAPDGWHPF